MPQVVIEVSAEEYGDLESIAENRLNRPEDAGHDLLVEAIAAEMADNPNARLAPT
jgi:hypothetical protein